MLAQSKELISRNYIWVILGVVCLCLLYITVKHRVLQMPGKAVAHLEHDDEDD